MKTKNINHSFYKNTNKNLNTVINNQTINILKKDIENIFIKIKDTASNIKTFDYKKLLESSPIFTKPEKELMKNSNIYYDLDFKFVSKLQKFILDKNNKINLFQISNWLNNILNALSSFLMFLSTNNIFWLNYINENILKNEVILDQQNYFNRFSFLIKLNNDIFIIISKYLNFIELTLKINLSNFFISFNISLEKIKIVSSILDSIKKKIKKNEYDKDKFSDILRGDLLNNKKWIPTFFETLNLEQLINIFKWIKEDENMSKNFFHYLYKIPWIYDHMLNECNNNINLLSEKFLDKIQNIIEIRNIFYHGQFILPTNSNNLIKNFIENVDFLFHLTNSLDEQTSFKEHIYIEILNLITQNLSSNIIVSNNRILRKYLLNNFIKIFD